MKIKTIALLFIVFFFGLIVGMASSSTEHIKTATITVTETKTLTKSVAEITSSTPATVTITKTATTTAITSSAVTTVITKVITKTVTKTVTLTPKPTAAGFKFKGISVTVRHRTPVLYVKFETDHNILIKIIGPDGVEKGFYHASADETGAYVEISDYCTTPLTGTYKLIISDLWGIIFEKNINFSGYNVSVVDVKLKSDLSKTIGYIIKEVSLVVRNTGDLPTFIDYGILSINGKEKRIYFSMESILPGEEKTITASTLIMGVPKTFNATLTLYNDGNEEVATYSFYVSL